MPAGSPRSSVPEAANWRPVLAMAATAGGYILTRLSARPSARLSVPAVALSFLGRCLRFPLGVLSQRTACVVLLVESALLVAANKTHIPFVGLESLPISWHHDLRRNMRERGARHMPTQ